MADLGQVPSDLVAVLPGVVVIFYPEVVAHQATAGQRIPLAIHAGHPGVLNKKQVKSIVLSRSGHMMCPDQFSARIEVT